MSLKSLVNKSIIKSDLRRYWTLSALFLVTLILTAAVPASQEIARTRGYENPCYYESGYQSWLFYDMWLSIGAALIFGITASAMVFSYLHHRSAVSMVHSLPIKREGLYVSHLISSAILTAAPVIAATLIMFTIKDMKSSWALVWAGLILVYLILAVGMGTLSAMITGNVFASLALPYIVILLPLFMETAIVFLCQRFLYGFREYSSFITEKLYDGFDVILDGMIWLYIALGIIFLILGFICCRKRQLENHSRLVAFNVLNPVFLYGFSLCTAISGYMYIDSMLDRALSFWLSVPFGIIGIIAARMIIERSMKPGNIIKPVIIYIAATAVIFSLTELDITGYEKRIPNIDSIDYVYLSNTSDETNRYPTPGDSYISVRLAPEARNDTKLTEKADIEKALAFHRAIIEQRGADEDYGRNHRYIPIEYKLKNGHTIKRTYNIALGKGELAELYDELNNTKPLKADRFPVISDSVKEYTSAQVMNFGVTTENLSKDQIEKIMAALREDISDSHISELNGDTITSVSVSQLMPSIEDDGTPITDKKRWASQTVTYNIHPSYTKSIALLKSWDMYNIMPQASGIVSVRIEEYDNDNYEIAKEITDKAEIQKLLDYVQLNQNSLLTDNLNGSYALIFNYSGGTAWTAILEKLPE